MTCNTTVDTMSFALHPLRDDDIPRCVSIYFDAFQNPHSLACWPRTPAVRAWWEQMLRDELHEPGAHWLKVVPVSSPRAAAAASSSPDDGFAGFVKWVEPRSGAAPDTQLPEWPAEADGRLCDETFGAWARHRAALMQTKAHWYLEVVATAPAYQGRGAGSLMLGYGTDRADEQGVEAYLEASPDAVPIYEKFGFREAERLDTWIGNDRVKGAWTSYGLTPIDAANLASMQRPDLTTAVVVHVAGFRPIAHAIARRFLNSEKADFGDLLA